MKVKPFKPMLAAAADDLTKIVYPVFVSPKLDGIRCVIRNGKALTRSLKPVPNVFIRETLEALAGKGLEGCDGELMIDDATFQEVTSCVMSPNDKPHSGWYYGVFDKLPGVGEAANQGFEYRLGRATHEVNKLDNHRVRLVPHKLIETEEALLSFEEDVLAEGFEGVMLRDPEGLYKFGRSTLREGGLLKLKRFVDDEAVIVGVEELMHNDNEAFEGELGQTKRSTAKAGLRGAGTLGALVVEHKVFGRFNIGTGFDQKTRDDLWYQYTHGGPLLQNEIIDPNKPGGAPGNFRYTTLVKFKYQSHGMKVDGKPRCPVFLGLRSKEDL